MAGTGSRGVITRRQFLGALLGLGALGGGALGGWYALRIEPHWIEVTRPVLEVANLPEPLDGLTIAQLSDTHAGLDDRESIRLLVERVNDLAPDLIVLTGDYLKDPRRDGPLLREDLAALRAPHGVYAILGNHDVAKGADRVAGDLQQGGITVLRHEAACVEVAGACLWLVGIEDGADSGWSGRLLHIDDLCARWVVRVARLESLLDGLPPGDPRILLVHNPDFNECLDPEAVRLDLALCGHTHGGQVRLPIIGAPVLPSVMGQKYVGGWAEAPASPVYTNRGVGSNLVNVRINARPEITLLTLRRTSTTDATE